MSLVDYNLKSFVHKLDNGLEVILCPNTAAPVAAVQVWCKTGSIHEDKCLGAGLSHVLEHMLFKGTTTRGGVELDHLIPVSYTHLTLPTNREV